MPPSWIVTGCSTGRGLVQRRGRGCPFSPLNPYSVGEYLLAPILQSYWIQVGDLIRKCALARPKYACIASYNECWRGLQDILDGCALLTSALLCWFALSTALYGKSWLQDLFTTYAIINHDRHVMLWNTNWLKAAFMRKLIIVTGSFRKLTSVRANETVVTVTDKHFVKFIAIIYKIEVSLLGLTFYRSKKGG